LRFYTDPRDEQPGKPGAGDLCAVVDGGALSAVAERAGYPIDRSIPDVVGIGSVAGHRHRPGSGLHDGGFFDWRTDYGPTGWLLLRVDGGPEYERGFHRAGGVCAARDGTDVLHDGDGSECAADFRSQPGDMSGGNVSTEPGRGGTIDDHGVDDVRHGAAAGAADGGGADHGGHFAGAAGPH